MTWATVQFSFGHLKPGNRLDYTTNPVPRNIPRTDGDRNRLSSKEIENHDLPKTRAGDQMLPRFSPDRGMFCPECEPAASESRDSPVHWDDWLR